MSDKKVTDQDYIYLSTLLRAREARMLTRETAERMIDAPGLDDAAKLLAECGYPDMSGCGAAQVEEQLSKHRTAIFAELESIAPEKEIIDVFRTGFDYHNAKVIIKSEGAGVEGGYLLSASGRIDPEKLVEAYKNEDFRDFPGEFRNAVLEAKSVLSRTENPQLADFVLDRAYFTEMSGAAAKVSSPSLKKYVECLADSVNLNAAVRTLRINRDAEFLRKALVPGGSRDIETIVQAAFGGDGLEPLFKSTFFEEAAAKGAQALSGGSLTAFEKECDDAVSRFLSDFKYIGFGAEVVIAYLAMVESGIKAARMILAGKLAGVKPEKLREQLRG